MSFIAGDWRMNFAACITTQIRWTARHGYSASNHGEIMVEVLMLATHNDRVLSETSVT